MAADISPEEKLLRLIKAKQKRRDESSADDKPEDIASLPEHKQEKTAKSGKQDEAATKEIQPKDNKLPEESEKAKEELKDVEEKSPGPQADIAGAKEKNLFPRDKTWRIEDDIEQEKKNAWQIQDEHPKVKAAPEGPGPVKIRLKYGQPKAGQQLPQERPSVDTTQFRADTGKLSTDSKHAQKAAANRKTAQPVRGLTSDNIVLYAVIAALSLSLCLAIIYFVFSGRDNKDIQNIERMIAGISDTDVESGGQDTAAVSSSEAPDNAVSVSTDQARSFQEYQKIASDKELFTPVHSSDVKDMVSDGNRIYELAKELKLVGIMPGERPQAIIEDKRSGQTLFLRKGDLIDAMQISDILEGKVILSYGEDNITLSM